MFINMSGIEFNKIIASIIIAIILFVIIGIIGNLLVNADKINNQEVAYKIDIPDDSADNVEINSESALALDPISPLLVSASLQNGEKLYKKCGTCHNYKKDSKSKVGPNLWDLIDRKKGSVSGFAYSQALIDHGGKWTYEELNGFLLKPKEYIQGTKMNFSGLKDVQDRADLILWLRKQSDNPYPLP